MTGHRSARPAARSAARPAPRPAGRPVVRRRAAALVALASALLLLTGCVSMPTRGRVVEAGPATRAAPLPGIAIDARPPQRGATPTEVVQGFLDAMLATPMQTRSAQQFLTPDARSSWEPGRATIVYGSRTLRGPGAEVSVTLGGAYRLDARGAWQGGLSDGARRLGFRLARVAGQWRIAEAPDALIVPVSWFEARFTQQALYFFDPAGQVLVPEPVFVPRGSQLATSLVRGLVAGPSASLAGTVRSFLPPGVGEGLSVPVDAAGTADIALTAAGDAPRQLSPQTLTLVTAQLGWTLRQDPSIKAVRLSIGGRAVQLASGRSEFSVEEGPEYDPAGYQTTAQMFGLDPEGRLVSGQPPRLAPVSGPFGRRGYAARTVVADLDGTRAAEVSTSGTVLRVGPVREGRARPRVAMTGTDLLRPAWDVAQRLWVVDATRRGARVSYVAGRRVREVRVPGITGARVGRFLVSRDGTRLVAVRRDPEGDRVVVSRLRSDEEGRIVGASPAVVISAAESAPLRIKDIAWSSPTTVLLLHQLSEGTQLRSVAVDGSSAAFPDQPVIVADRVDALLSSPVAGQGAYGVFGTQMRGLTGDTRDSVLEGPVTSLGFAG